MYFGARQIEYLGYVQEAGQVKIKERVEQIRRLKQPTTVMELRKALGAFAFVQTSLKSLEYSKLLSLLLYHSIL